MELIELQLPRRRCNKSVHVLYSKEESLLAHPKTAQHLEHPVYHARSPHLSDFMTTQVSHIGSGLENMFRVGLIRVLLGWKVEIDLLSNQHIRID